MAKLYKWIAKDYNINLVTQSTMYLCWTMNVTYNELEWSFTLFCVYVNFECFVLYDKKMWHMVSKWNFVLFCVYVNFGCLVLYLYVDIIAYMSHLPLARKKVYLTPHIDSWLLNSQSMKPGISYLSLFKTRQIIP